jgi:hypothetical protein
MAGNRDGLACACRTFSLGNGGFGRRTFAAHTNAHPAQNTFQFRVLTIFAPHFHFFIFAYR